MSSFSFNVSLPGGGKIPIYLDPERLSKTISTHHMSQIFGRHQLNVSEMRDLDDDIYYSYHCSSGVHLPTSYPSSNHGSCTGFAHDNPHSNIRVNSLDDQLLNSNLDSVFPVAFYKTWEVSQEPEAVYHSDPTFSNSFNTESLKFVNAQLRKSDFNLQSLLDTGAQASIISAEVVLKYNLPVFPLDKAPTLTGFAGTENFVPKGFCTLFARVGLREPRRINFLILDNIKLQSECIIGNSDLKLLGIQLSFLNFSPPDPELDCSPFFPKWSTCSAEASHPAHIVAEVEDSISQVRRDNEIMKLRGEPCRHPNAVYRVRDRLTTQLLHECNSYRKNYSRESLDIIDIGVKDVIARKVLVPISTSQRGARLNWVLVRKEGRDVRLCVDSTNLNKQIPKVVTDIESANDLFNKLRSNKKGCIISALDIAKAYFCIPFADDEVGVLYVEHQGKDYGFARTPFGLTDLPKHFVNIMTDIFKDMKNVLVYFDDILIVTETLEEHKLVLNEVIRRCNEYNFPLNFDKCKFACQSLKYLGMVIDRHSIRPDPEKVQGIVNTPSPNHYKELASFLGLFNYLRRFIPRVSDLTAQLHKIAAKYSAKPKLKFEAEDQRIVDQHSGICKQAMTNAISLSLLPNKDLSNVEMILHTDASMLGYGGVLSYLNDEGILCPISTYSKVYNKYEMNYTIPKKELLAIIACVSYWEEFLSANKFTIYTDHKALTYLLNSEAVAHRTVKGWLYNLSRFDFKVLHIAGEDNVFADWLSRCGQIDIDEGHIYANTVRLNQNSCSYCTRDAVMGDDDLKSWFQLYVNNADRTNRPLFENDEVGSSSDSSGNMTNLIRAVRCSQIESTSPSNNASHPSMNLLDDSDEEPANIVHEFSDDELLFSEVEEDIFPKDVQSPKNSKIMLDDFLDELTQDSKEVEFEYSSIGGHTARLTSKAGRSVKRAGHSMFTIPDVDDRIILLNAAHDADHGSAGTMVKRIIEEGFYWKGIHSDALDYRNACLRCYGYNKIGQYKFLSARSLEASRPWQWLQMDLSGPLVRTDRGNAYILVCIDLYTGFVVLLPLSDKETKSVAEAFAFICGLFGPPRILQTDNGGEFSGGRLEEVVKSLSIEHRFSASYKPNTNGLVERTVGSMKSILNKFMADYGSHQWDLLLPSITIAMNSRVRSSTNNAPFFMLFWRKGDGVFQSDYSNSLFDFSMSEWVESNILPQLDYFYKEIDELQAEAKEKIRKVVNNRRAITAPLDLGTAVFVENVSRADKSKPPWNGPYRVVGHDALGNHIVKEVVGHKGALTLSRKVPREQLKAVVLRNSQDLDKQYIVKSIGGMRDTDSRDVNGKVIKEYLVNFNGYGDEDNQWIASTDFGDVTILQDYHLALGRRNSKGGSFWYKVKSKRGSLDDD